ncbi:hypothetical protein WN51_02296 [Melipona quadrifasciata]|uniref:Uncharacterized protein n=1 Tax=Melipona quadrifasciata TaxID=166423 RepID=A0A0M8ZVD8_9HYME|nr:hypothetical protein WN51_02296 [Melipona quadrifasciata]
MEIDLGSYIYENFVTLYFEELTELESFERNEEIDFTNSAAVQNLPKSVRQDVTPKWVINLPQVLWRQIGKFDRSRMCDSGNEVMGRYQHPQVSLAVAELKINTSHLDRRRNKTKKRNSSFDTQEVYTGERQKEMVILVPEILRLTIEIPLHERLIRSNDEEIDREKLRVTILRKREDANKHLCELSSISFLFLARLLSASVTGPKFVALLYSVRS